MGQESAQPQRRRHFARHLLPQLALDDQQIHADGKVVDTQSARQLTALAGLEVESDSMFDEQLRTVSRKLPTVQDAAEDIRRVTAALEARRQVAPDNLVELAALAVDLQRASAVWRRLVPSGFRS